MRIQGASLTAGVSQSAASKYDMMIERVKGKIQGVNGEITLIEEDMRLTPEEKKEKTVKLYEELEGYKQELGRTKAARTNAVMMEKAKDDDTAVTSVNDDGDTLEVSKVAMLHAEYGAMD